jgi:hypothetical protein
MPLSDTEVRKLQQQAPPQLREAEVVDPPLTAEGFIRVEVDGQRGDVKECPWVTRFSGSPAKGDAAAVIESDGGNFWALWWPQNGQEPSEGGGGDEWFLFAGAPDPAQGGLGDLALSANGDYFEKTAEATWTLRGSLKGTPGAPGTDGTDGTPGADGAPGESAYELAVANGFVGTEEDWLASLEGAPGPPGAGVEDLDPVVVSVGRSTTITPTASAYYPVPFDVEHADADGFWDSAWKFQPTKPGWYDVESQLYVDTLSGSPQLNLYLVKNRTGTFPATGTVEAYDTTYSFAASGETIGVLNASKRIYFNGSTDFVEVYVWFTNGRIQSTNGTYFQASSVSVVGPEGPPWVPEEYDQAGWQTFTELGITFSNGWREYTLAGTEWLPRARLYPDGSLHFTGLIDKNGGNFTAQETMFTLPPGLRPADGGRAAGGSDFYEASCSGGGSEGRCQVRIWGDGQVKIGTYGGPANPVNWVALSELIIHTKPAGPVLQGPIGPEGPPWVPEDYTLDTWHYVGAPGEPAFLSAAFKHYDGASQTPSVAAGARNVGFRKYPDGTVRLRGVISNTGGVGGYAFTLPVGYRPTITQQQWQSVYPANAAMPIIIESDGRVYINNQTYAFLDSISFDTDTVTQMLAGPRGPEGPPWVPEDYELEPWTTATLNTTNWAHIAGLEVQYKKDPTGRVDIRGVARAATIFSYGTVTGRIFTLPEGYRPARNQNFDRIHWDNDGSVDLARITILPDGTVYVYGFVTTGSAISGAANSQQNLDGISFNTDTVTQMLAGPRGPAGGLVSDVEVVTVLPAAPEDGEEVDYLFQQTVVPADATWRTWRLRYHATIAAWLPVGAQEPIYAEDAVQRSQAFGVGWSQFSAQALNAYFPLKGLYRFEFGCGMAYNNVSSNNYVGLSLWDGSAQAWPSLGTTQPSSGAYAAGAGGTASYGGIHGNKKVSVVQRAGDLATLGVFGSAGGTWSANNRYIRAYPMRIDP